MSTNQADGMQAVTRMMTHYMAWANRMLMDALAQLPPEELTKPRQTLFGNIAHTLNHILVIGDIFRAHLEGRKHGYTARNTDTTPPFAEICERLTAMDRDYTDLAGRLSADALNETIRFEFVGGGDGAMTRQEILLHLVSHASYHRGFIADMLYQIPFRANANDLPVFLRDVWPGMKS
jgi:uncharacterized damage-inducible protein DinB